MRENQKKTISTLEDCEATALACQKALADTCRALKAFSFYPQSHPLREQLLQVAYQSITQLTRSGRLSLIVQRGGFSFAELQAPIENTPMTRALAQELFARELQRLTFLPELSLADFTGFLSLLTVTPQKISESGGVAQMLKESGMLSISVNQIDISAVFTKKKTGDCAAGQPLADGADALVDEEPEIEQATGGAPDQLSTLSIEELLAAMAGESDDSSYARLARMLLEKARLLKQAGEFERIYGVQLAILEQRAEAARSDSSRGCALMVLQQLSLGEMTGYLLDRLEEREFPGKEAVCLILAQLGVDVIDPIIRRLIAAGSKPSRKSLATALVRIGTPAQPALLALLRDGRWQVVHMAIAMLGEVGNRDAVKALAATVSHPENRVRMEGIRSLARIGGAEATAVLISLLQDQNHAIAGQAITWLGNSRNQAALQPLIQLVMKRDFLGKRQDLKKEALSAICRIGDRRALNPLFRLVEKRYWIASGRWDELKLLALQGIATLGGESARAFLQGASARGGRLGRACSEALESLAQRDDDHE